MRRRWGSLAVAAAFLRFAFGFGALHTHRLTAERNRTQDALTRTERVTTFLVSVVDAGSPYTQNQPVGGIHVVDVLRRAGDAPASDLSGEVAVQAELLHALGEVSANLALYDEAKTYLDRAYALRNAAQQASTKEIARSLRGHAAYYTEQGDYDRARSFADRVLALLQQAYGPESTGYADGLVTAANVYHEGSRSPEELARREAHLRRVIAIRRSTMGRGSPDMAEAMAHLETVLIYQGRLDEAELLLSEARDIHETAGRGDAWSASSVLNNLGGVNHERNVPAQAVLKAAEHPALLIAERRLKALRARWRGRREQVEER